MLPQTTFTLSLFCIFQHICHDTVHYIVEHKSVLKQKNLVQNTTKQVLKKN